jgi:hypothetical protein
MSFENARLLEMLACLKSGGRVTSLSSASGVPANDNAIWLQNVSTSGSAPAEAGPQARIWEV